MDSSAKKKKQSEKDKRDFVTFALDHVKHLTIHRQRKEEGVNMEVAKKPHSYVATAVDKWKMFDEELLQKGDQ